MPNVTVQLSKRYVTHTAFDTLEFREPTYLDIIEVGGDPYVLIPVPGREGFVDTVPVHEKVDAYAKRLIREGDQAGKAEKLWVLNIADTKRVAETVIGFFQDADPRLRRGSSGSDANSSSGSDGTPTPSSD